MATNRQADSGASPEEPPVGGASPGVRDRFVWAPGSHADRVPFRGLGGRPIRRYPGPRSVPSSTPTLATWRTRKIRYSPCRACSASRGSARTRALIFPTVLVGEKRTLARRPVEPARSPDPLTVASAPRRRARRGLPAWRRSVASRDGPARLPPARRSRIRHAGRAARRHRRGARVRACVGGGRGVTARATHALTAHFGA